MKKMYNIINPVTDVRKSAKKILTDNENGIKKIKIIKNLSIKSESFFKKLIEFFIL